MHYAFQDKDNLYLVMDMLSGGDLRYHISRYRRFSEEQTRFFIACIIYSLEYIHANKVIHRDIKPENLVLDAAGYVRITDFGIAKENMPDNSSETSGTPGYMSPEVMKGKNHSYPVDFFAIGVIGYEFMIGKRPYYGKNRKEIKELMLAKQACIKQSDLQKGWSPESSDFINKLLLRKPEQRLGHNGAKDLKEHPWLKYYPWSELEEKTLPAPFIPENRDNFDKRYCEGVDKITEETKMRYEEILLGTTINKAFEKFFYNKDTKRTENHNRDGLRERIQSREENNNKMRNSNSLGNNEGPSSNLGSSRSLANSNSQSSKNIFSKNLIKHSHHDSYEDKENSKNCENKVNNNSYKNSLNQPSSVQRNNNNMKIPFPQISGGSKNEDGAKKSASKRPLSHSKSTCEIKERAPNSHNLNSNHNNSTKNIFYAEENKANDYNNYDSQNAKNMEANKINNNNNWNIFSQIKFTKFAYNFPQKNIKSNRGGNHVRSSSVINFKNKNSSIKNKIYESNNNPNSNRNNIPIPHSSQNHGANKASFKKLSRVNSASRILNHSSSDFGNNAKNQIKNINKNNANYNYNNINKAF